jgi:hypothetical protein
VRIEILIAVALGLAMPCAAQHAMPKKYFSRSSQVQAPELNSTILLQNSDITLRRLDIPPKEEAPIAASTHDYLLISIGSNSITVKGDTNSFDLTFGPGDMQVVEGGWKHALVNNLDTKALLFMIEPARNIDPKKAICGLGATSCSEHRFGETAEGTYVFNLQFETETTKLYRLTMQAGVAMHMQSSGKKQLVIALTPFTGHNDKEKFSIKAGDMRWIPSGFDVLGNDGPAEVRALILELQ